MEQVRCKELGEHLQACTFMHLSLVWSETQQRVGEQRVRIDTMAAQMASKRDELRAEVIQRCKSCES